MKPATGRLRAPLESKPVEEMSITEVRATHRLYRDQLEKEEADEIAYVRRTWRGNAVVKNVCIREVRARYRIARQYFSRMTRWIVAEKKLAAVDPHFAAESKPTPAGAGA